MDKLFGYVLGHWFGGPSFNNINKSHHICYLSKGKIEAFLTLNLYACQL